MQSRVDDYYNAFIQAVAVGRGVTVDVVRNGMGEGRVLGADAALAQRMVDGIASFDDVLARMQAKVTGNAVRSQAQKGPSRLKQARDALALV
jgi:ClpP class serine protease